MMTAQGEEKMIDFIPAYTGSSFGMGTTGDREMPFEIPYSPLMGQKRDDEIESLKDSEIPHLDRCWFWKMWYDDGFSSLSTTFIWDPVSKKGYAECDSHIHKMRKANNAAWFLRNIFVYLADYWFEQIAEEIEEEYRDDYDDIVDKMMKLYPEMD